MAGLVEKFDNWQTKMKNRKETRVNDKRERGKDISEWLQRSHPAKTDLEKYRENWESIFGKGGSSEGSNPREGLSE